MVLKRLGALTAYGHAKEGGYTGTQEEWYNLFLLIVSGSLDVPYDTFAERPLINDITVTGNKTFADYDIYDRFGGSYFRIKGNAGDSVEINGVDRGVLDDDGKALLGGVMEVGTTTIKIGDTEKVIDTPYFGLYRVSK